MPSDSNYPVLSLQLFYEAMPGIRSTRKKYSIPILVLFLFVGVHESYTITFTDTLIKFNFSLRAVSIQGKI